MLANQLSAAFRNLAKNKLLTVINIGGLLIGLTCVTLISLWVDFELSHDRFHTNAGQIYQISYGQESITMPGGLVKILKDNYPEVAAATHFMHRSDCKLTSRRQGFFADGSYADPAFLTMFSFPLLQGDPATALANPQSIIITRQLAERIFGGENPVGQTIQFDDVYQKTTRDLVVTGVLANIPENTHFKVKGENLFEFLVPWQLAPGWIDERIDVNMLQIYVQLAANTPGAAFARHIAPLMRKFDPAASIELGAIPLTHCYLYDLGGGGRIVTVYIFSFIGLFILFIAGVNFINLSTACAERWKKQIGIRKTLGASKTHVVTQFLGESVISAYLAMLGAVAVSACLLPWVNARLDTAITWPRFSPVTAGLLLLPLLAGLLAGLYPAFVLSSFQPTDLIKTRPGPGEGRFGQGLRLRNLLIICQFALAIILLAFSIIIFQQHRHLQRQDLGYQRENIMVIRRSGELERNVETAKQELRKLPFVQAVSFSANPVTQRYVTEELSEWETGGKSQPIELGLDWVDYDYQQLLGFQMVEGRFLSAAHAGDADSGVVVNEAAVRAMNLSAPVGKYIKLNGNDDRLRIVGVMRDFNIESLRERIKPHAFVYGKTGSFLYVKIAANADLSAVIPRIGQAIRTVAPTDPFRYMFLTDELDALYTAERTSGLLFTGSSLIAILVAGMGLIGLGYYTTSRRVKEIGIRKVLGATSFRVVRHLTKPLLQWILLANLVAWPVAWILVDRWLQSFAYRIEPGAGPFLLAGGAVFLFALMTLTLQTLRAASANPAHSLKHE